MYADNTYKLVAVLNSKYETSQLMNALSHMTAGVVSQQDRQSPIEFLDYRDADGSIHPRICRWSFVILKAKNSNQIRKLRRAIHDAELTYSDFVHTMFGASAQDQIERTEALPESELDYLGLCAFGPAEILNPLTKRFSLFKGSLTKAVRGA